MTVKELARKTGIALTTIYSIIQRDAAIRFDTALRISNILDIPINSICKDNPYDGYGNSAKAAIRQGSPYGRHRKESLFF